MMMVMVGETLTFQKSQLGGKVNLLDGAFGFPILSSASRKVFLTTILK